MSNRAQRKILQTRNILALVVIACAAKLAKIIIDGNADTRQVVALIIVIIILAAVLVFYTFIDRYTKEEQKTYGEPKSPTAEVPPAPQPAGLKGILKEIFKHNAPGK